MIDDVNSFVQRCSSSFAPTGGWTGRTHWFSARFSGTQCLGLIDWSAWRYSLFLCAFVRHVYVMFFVLCGRLKESGPWDRLMLVNWMRVSLFIGIAPAPDDRLRAPCDVFGRG